MRLAGPALLALALAGCGSATQASLEQASEATSEETSRFESTYRFAGPDNREYEFTYSGAFDYPNERGVMMTGSWAPFLGEGVELREARVLGNVGFTRWVVKGKTHWVKQDPLETSSDPVQVLIPGPGTPTKPTDVLWRVLRASDGSQKLGSEQVRAADTTHYRAQVDLTKLVEQLPPAERPEPDVQRSWGERFVPVDLWIDDDSRLRRIEIARRGSGNDETAKQTFTVELFDYGVDVEVQPPPADETISQAEFDKIVGPMGLEMTEAGEGEETGP
jgi:hypothetical protein